MEVSLLCPHCGKHTAVSPAPLEAYPEPGFPQSVPLGHFMQVGVPFYPVHNDQWWMGKCNACEMPMLVCGRGSRILPPPQPSPSDERIPEHIRADLDEAKLCMTVGAARACATMARGAIQATCLLKGANEGKKLYEQIAQLASKGLITTELRDWATEVRHLGNDGAHPPKDFDKDTISEEDASDSLELAEQFLEVIFVTPALAAERKRKRTEKK